MREFRTTLMIAIIVLAFCARKEEKIAGEPGGRLVIGTLELPERLSPLEPSVFSSNDLLELIFLRLHAFDPATGKMVPVLAESWEFSEDLKSLTYYLRKNITWWDGTAVTAHDVLYTYQQMKDPATGHPNVNALRFISEVRVINDYAVKFTFDKVYADILTDSDIMPVPRHIHEQVGSDFGRYPVGNGPYRIREWIVGSGIALEANDDYFRGRPPLDEIVVRYYANAPQMFGDFSAGDLDLIFNIAPAAAQELRRDKDVTIHSRPGDTYLYIAWNQDHPFLKERAVREALAMTVDRKRMVNEIYGGMAELSRGPLPPSSWGYDEAVEMIDHNVDQARAMLEAQGFVDFNRNRLIDKDRKDFTLRIITNAESPDRVAILRYVAEDLQQIGVRVVPQVLAANDFVAALVDRQFDAFIMGWHVADKIDPAVIWHSEGRYNLVSYANATADSLIDTGIAMLDRNSAKEVWNEFQKVVYEDQPYLFLVVPDDISATYDFVKGVGPGLGLANAHNYWIPASERRATAVALVREVEPSAETLTREAAPASAPESIAMPDVQPTLVIAP
ncbi:hypothetical protein IBX73_07000, partial [candidate division WOR-3 bacterium]|nr:hypothetical protein [candidate division WOR-3 bacterium]